MKLLFESSKSSVALVLALAGQLTLTITASLYKVHSVLSAALSCCSGASYPPPSPAPLLVHAVRTWPSDTTLRIRLSFIFIYVIITFNYCHWEH